MVERKLYLDGIFGALADQTRRHMLQRLVRGPLTVGELAEPYAMSLAAAAKHIRMLETARLVHKERKGKSQIVTVNTTAPADALQYLEYFRRHWSD